MLSHVILACAQSLRVTDGPLFSSSQSSPRASSALRIKTGGRDVKAKRLKIFLSFHISNTRLDRELKYDEPWGWIVPAEHALGALLLEQGRVDEAIKVFR